MTTQINKTLIKVTQTFAEDFGFSFINENSAGAYVLPNATRVLTLSYADVNLLDIEYQTANDFFHSNYKTPVPYFSIYRENNDMVRIFDDIGSYATDEEKQELIEFLNDKLVKAGVVEKFDEEALFYAYDCVRSNEPEDLSSDVEDYLYDVIFQKEGEVDSSYNDLNFSKLYRLVCEKFTCYAEVVVKQK